MILLNNIIYKDPKINTVFIGPESLYFLKLGTICLTIYTINMCNSIIP